MSKPPTAALVTSTVRHALTGIGAMLITLGIVQIDEGKMLEIVGVLSYIAGQAWSYYNKTEVAK